MDRLLIPSQKDSPEINFDAQSGVFSIMGISHPENIAVLFEPVLTWIDDYKEELSRANGAGIEQIKLKFFFIYINSATYKYLITVILKISELLEYGAKLDITWYYEPDDIDMRDAGVELSQYIDSDIVFTTKEKERLR